MPNRRDFIKAMMVVGVSQLGIKTDNYPAMQEIDNSERPVGPTTRNITWNRNIFCQFDNEELKKAVEKCAIETDSSIFYGISGDPDIFACPAFVLIIDRNLVGHDLWQEYVQDSDFCGYDTPCFIVDNNSHLPIPKNKYVYQFDMDNRTTIPTIIETIKQMRTELDRRLPDLFKSSNHKLEI
ncbi:MAG: hypothetical protein ABSE95_05165 [Thermodesulfobacteriota bacterium]